MYLWNFSLKLQNSVYDINLQLLMIHPDWFSSPFRHMNSQSISVQSSRQACPTVQLAYSDDSGYTLPQHALRVNM